MEPKNPLHTKEVWQWSQDHRIYWTHYLLHRSEVAGFMEQWNEFSKVHLRCKLGDDNLKRRCLPTTKEGFNINQSPLYGVGSTEGRTHVSRTKEWE